MVSKLDTISQRTRAFKKVSKLGTFSAVNFWSTWPEVNCVQVGHNFRWFIFSQLLAIMARSKLCPSWTPFPSEHGLSKRFPSWEPFLWSTSVQVEQKLIVTMKVTVFASETSAQVGQKLKCGPTWSTFFIPGTSDQLGPKLEIRAKLARIIWPGRRQKCAPSWRTF